jgi:oxazoline/thiazoline dehydrogenase
VTDRPQILLVLAARYQMTRHMYGDLSYSLILKEVGAVFQAAMMAAAAMGIGSCALGCGDSIEFSGLLGLNPRVETSVGELILGSLENSA